MSLPRSEKSNHGVALPSLILCVSCLVAGAARALPLGPTSAKIVETDGKSGTSSGPDLFMGAMTSTFPIEVPPGRNGMQPTILLRYSSQNGNGLVGVGWALELGAIERQTKNGVIYSADAYVFRTSDSTIDLMSLGGGSYSLKYEGMFLRIRQLVAADALPRWEVTDRSGRVMLYGTTAGSRVGSGNAIFRWALDSVQDTDGNNLSVTYSRNLTQLYPSSIAYAGHTSGIAPSNTVSFTWEPRPDVGSSFVSGFELQTALRLSRIDTVASGQLVRRYQLTYQTSQPGRSKLSTITQLGSDGTTALPPETMTWTSSTVNQFTTSNPLMTGVYGARSGLPMYGADIDGDGYGDVIVGPDANGNVFLLTGTATGQFVDRGIWTTVLNGNIRATRLYFADVNADGKQDMILMQQIGVQGPGYFQPFFSTGVGPPTAGIAVGIDGGIVTERPGEINVFDVNGDGLADVVIGPIADGTFDVYKSTAMSDGTAQFGLATVTATRYGNWNTDLIRPMDVNGDGKTDLVLGPDQQGNWSALVSQGDGAFVDTPWGFGYGNWNGLPQFIRPADVNGDGKTDLVLGPDSAGNWYVMASTGNSFVDKGAWITGAYAAWSDDAHAPGIYAVDVNGDGMTDIVLGPDGQFGEWFLLQSTGLGFSDQRAQAFGVGESGQGPGSGLPLDINGDGIIDFLVKPTSSGRWYASVAARPADLLGSITESAGARTTITYASTTHFSNTYLPFALQVVSALAVDDGNGNVGTSNYTYAGGYYYSLERDFRGFSSVSVAGPAWPNGARAQSTTYFHQGNDVGAANNYAVAAGYMKGKPYRMVEGDTASTAYKETDIGYQGSSVPYFTPVSQVLTSFNTAGSAARNTRTTYVYDAYGNTLREDHYGDLADPSDDYTITRQFAPNLTTRVLGLATSIAKYAGTGAQPAPDSGNQVERTDYCYDGPNDCATPCSSTMPSVGHLTATTRWLPSGTGPVTRSGFDAYGNQVCVADARGNITRTGFDASNTFPIKVTNPLGQSMNLTYYGVGGVPAAGGPYGLLQSMTDPNQLTTSITYDPLGRKRTQTEPDGLVTTWTFTDTAVAGTQKVATSNAAQSDETYFDGLGRTIVARSRATANARWLTSKTVYLSTGAVAKASLPFFEPNGTPAWTTFEYDPQGRRVSTTGPDGAPSQACYDDSAGVTVTIDANRHKHRVVTDVFNRTVEVGQYKGSYALCTTEAGTPYSYLTHKYDLAGRMTQTMNSVGAPVETSYDTLGRRVALSDPDIGNWSYQYDAAGNLVAQTDQKGQTISYGSYDALNRARTKHYPTGVDVTYTYDDPATAYSIGQVTKFTDGSGSTSFVYDKLGRATASTHLVGTSSYAVQRSYNPARRLSSMTYPDGTTITYSYDADGNLSRVSDAAAGITYATLTDYDELRRPGSITYPTSTGSPTSTYSYDPANKRLRRIATTSGAQKLQSLDYQYDPVGNVTEVTDTSSAAVSTSRSFGYDELNRLVDAQSGAYTPDVALPADGLHYTYDPVRVHVLSTTSDGHSFTHDGNGNMTGDGSRAMAWNYDNQLASLTLNGATVTFAYDALGNRVQKRAADGTTTTYVDGIYECSAPSSICTKYIYAGTKLLAVVHGSDPTVNVHSDGNGSPTVTTQGQNVGRAFFQPYGRTASDTNPATLHRKYNGQELDPETGLYLMGARYYDPALARFLNADAAVPGIENVQAWNRYAFALNNPVRFADPSGHGVFDLFTGTWDLLTHDPFTGPLLAITAAVTVASDGATTPILLGEISGGLSARAHGGDVDMGMFVGGALGGAEVAIAGPILGLAGALQESGTMLQQVGSMAGRGAFAGAFLGASAGYEGGRGRFSEITISTLEGAAFGAGAGAMKPLVLGRVVTARVAETLDEAKSEDAAKGFEVTGVDVTVRTGGAWQWAYRTFGQMFAGSAGRTGAMTIGSTMNVDETVIEGSPSDLLQYLRHELGHVWQAQQLGLGGYVAKYLYGWATKGYEMNPMEVEARSIGGF